MILVTRFTFIVEKVEKTCTFTLKWLDHLQLMTSYLVTIEIDHHFWTSLKMRARGMNKPLLKTSVADVLPSMKKIRKTLERGGCHPPLPPIPCTSKG